MLDMRRLSSKEFGSGPCRTYIPRDIFETFSPPLQLLYRHLAEGVDDYLQPPNQVRLQLILSVACGLKNTGAILNEHLWCLSLSLARALWWVSLVSLVSFLSVSGFGDSCPRGGRCTLGTIRQLGTTATYR